MNRLYFGDNLDILRKHVANDSIQLIYLDPPFNSKATYNISTSPLSGQMRNVRHLKTHGDGRTARKSQWSECAIRTFASFGFSKHCKAFWVKAT